MGWGLGPAVEQAGQMELQLLLELESTSPVQQPECPARGRHGSDGPSQSSNRTEIVGCQQHSNVTASTALINLDEPLANANARSDAC